MICICEVEPQQPPSIRNIDPMKGEMMCMRMAHPKQLCELSKYSVDSSSSGFLD